MLFLLVVVLLMGCMNAFYSTFTHLNDMQFGQKVAVSQSQAVAIQELPVGGCDVLGGILVNLFWEGRVQVVVQSLELP